MEAVAAVNAMQGALVTLAALGLTAHKWTTNVTVEDNAVYDYIVVGAGTAGSVVANRLTEDAGARVLLLEAGGDPPFETEIPALFPLLTKSSIDWNYVSEDDGYSAQYHRNRYLDLPSGKVIGGSSSIHHFYYVRGNRNDYKAWADAAKDDMWSWKNLLPYFKKSQRLEDKDILDSKTGHYHGTNGYVATTRELRESPLKYLEAFQEVGHQVVDDINTGHTVGFTRPMFSIGDGIRQSSAQSFLLPIKNRPNLHLMKEISVDKILFDGNKNAVGVQATSNGKPYNFYTRKEIIVSAGAFNSPKLLMLSGVGPKAHLDSMGIELIADLPVGENMEDHLAILLAHKLEKTHDAPKPENPALFPLPTFVGLGALNKKQGYPDYLTLNLIYKNNPTNLMFMCAIIFGLHDDACKQLSDAGRGREILISVFNVARPLSRGKVMLRSPDPQDPPKIYTGFLSNSTDLENNAAYIEEFIQVTKSSYFRKVGGETLYFDLPNCKGLKQGTREYWKCYVLNMMDTTFHYSSTCRMGSVLDARLRVLAVRNLRVVDASAMPNTVSANINAAVMALAEKAADLIKEDAEQHDTEYCTHNKVQSSLDIETEHREL